MKLLFTLLLLVSPITSYAKNVDNFIQEAMKYNQAGNTKKAIQAFIKASELSPNNADIHYSIGVLKGCPNGLPHYKNTIKVNKNYYPAFLNSGICYEKLKKNIIAIKFYTSALNLKPNNASLQYNVGNLLHISKKYQESLPFYRNALKLDPSHYWAALNLGNSYEELNQLQKAIRSFNKAKEIDPNKSAAFLSLANPLITLKSYKKAKNALETAGRLAIKNNNPQIATPVLTYLKRHYPKSNVITQLKLYLKK